MWTTTEKFERDLQDDIKGFQIEKDYIIKGHQRKYEMLKQKT